ncbi:MAG: WD40/YVTN/BNR-like repeat-containing protein [Myxococcota bacterium]
MQRRTGPSKSATRRRPATRAGDRSARARRPASQPRIALLVATRKGAFFFHANAARTRWRVDGPHFLGQIVNHVVLDPRDRRTLLAAVRPGQLGPTIFRSRDFGATWEEAKQPPAFKKAREGEAALAVNHTFHLTPGHSSEPDVWYAAVSPPALFRSGDAGVTWSGVDGWNEHPMRFKWCPPEDQTPDGAMLHSVLVDPRDARHLYVSASGGGSFESTNRGESWRPLNEAVEVNFGPDPHPEFGQDPHCVALHPLRPDRLYQQNHCGIYRLDRPATRWVRIGKNMPTEIGDIGFGIALHPREPDTAWVFPMDGTLVWPRTSPDGKPALYCTRDAGATWQRQDRGLPREQAWYTVKRQAFCADAADPVGVYFGTTSGELWMSPNEGRSFRQIAAHLPHVYSVVAAILP